MPLYDFRDKRGHVTESREGVETTSIPCPRCGLSATRVQVYRTTLIDLDMGLRGQAIGRRRQENRDYFEARELVGTAYSERERNGDPVRKRDLAGDAKREARRLMAK